MIPSPTTAPNHRLSSERAVVASATPTRAAASRSTCLRLWSGMAWSMRLRTSSGGTAPMTAVPAITSR